MRAARPRRAGPSSIGLPMKLYRQFETQDELDAAYNPTVIRPDSAGFFERWAMPASAPAGSRLPTRRPLRTRPARSISTSFLPGAGAPVHIFVHGGYWRRFSAREHDFLAPSFVAEGIAFVSVNYALCPEVTIDEIVRQVRAAVAWVHRHASGVRWRSRSHHHLRPLGRRPPCRDDALDRLGRSLRPPAQTSSRAGLPSAGSSTSLPSPSRFSSPGCS